MRDTAARELTEETGLIAATFEQILRTDMSNSVTDEIGYVFVARRLTQSEMNPEDTEDLAYVNCHLSTPSRWRTTVRSLTC